MKTVTFKSVYEQVMRLCGLDPSDTDNFSSVRQEMVADCITRRVRDAWEWAPWPELCVIEERTPVSGVVAYTQSGETVLGEVFGVWNVDPRTSPNQAKQYQFEPTEDGIEILDDTVGDTVFVHFRRVPARFTRVAWVSGASYALGDLVYFDTTGEVYQATVSDESETWTLVSFPYVIEAFVVYAAAADVHRDLGQDDKADKLEGRAYRAIDEQVMKTFNQQQQTKRVAIMVE